MGILIITIVSLIISYIIYKITKFDWFGVISAISTFVLVAGILIIGLSHAFSYIDVINYQNDKIKDVINYQNDKIKIETAINNPQITGEERASVIDIITKDNNKLWV